MFPSRSKPGHTGDIRKALERIKKKANIEGITTHDLRRGFSSMLVQMGEDLRTIGELIGHKDFRTTQKVYAHLGNNKLRQASERIAGKVEELLSTSP